MNKAIIIGNLTKDPELKTTQSGISVCSFTLAVNRRYKDSQGNTPVDYLNIIVWREAGENCAKFLKKGKKAAVVGEIQTRSYEAQDGSKRYVTEIVASEVEFLSPRTEAAPAADTSQEFNSIADEELPF